MNTLAIYEGLSAAHKLLTATRRTLTNEPSCVWQIVSDATDHINKQVRELLLSDEQV
jgi:hypothetical protein